MQQEIAVNTVSLGQKVQDLEANMAQIKSKVDNMYDEVTALDKMWDGPANAQFTKQFNADKTSMDELCEEIKKIFTSMDEAKKEYEICENDVSQIISSIRI